MAVTENTITTTELSDAKVREVEFTLMFEENIKKLMEVLGVTRMIPKKSGTILKTYKASGTLASGKVAEGEVIPLSKYTVKPVNYKELTIDKWRKATTIEAVSEYGFDQARTKTSDRMLLDVQKSIRKEFFDFLATGTATATGVGLQAALANSWGKLRNLFDDDSVSTVYFINPEDISDYLATAPITVQTAFGMSYTKNFLGLGTVIMNSYVPKGKYFATASENINLQYLNVKDTDISKLFDMTTDATGLIGIHEEADYSNMTSADTVISGIALFAERIDGVIVGTITAAAE